MPLLHRRKLRAAPDPDAAPDPAAGGGAPPRGGRPGRARLSAGRINRLAAMAGAKTYLEIGVARGVTFLAVDIATKHAVDPGFRFDTAPHKSGTVRFFPVTSDAYFAREASAGLKFDLIFLDGLHTFEQTFRDFCASQAHAHDDTIWIIDDIFPNDVFSALPSQAEAYAFRERAGGASRLWHGDVYKCVLAIADFFPNLSFRSFAPGQGNPQTVLLRRPRPDFAPRFGNLETISRLDYFGFWTHREALNLAPEDEVFAWVEATLKR